MSSPAFEEIATFIVAMVILGGSFYGLLREDGATIDHTAYVALIGVVGTFYFQRAAIGMAIKRLTNGNGK